jgi:hypothetical protein
VVVLPAPPFWVAMAMVRMALTVYGERSSVYRIRSQDPDHASTGEIAFSPSRGSFRFEGAGLRRSAAR